MLMGKGNALFHIFHRKILGFCTQSKCFAANVNGIRSKDDRRL